MVQVHRALLWRDLWEEAAFTWLPCSVQFRVALPIDPACDWNSTDLSLMPTLLVLLDQFSRCGSVWLERCVRDAETGGSNPLTSTMRRV